MLRHVRSTSASWSTFAARCCSLLLRSSSVTLVRSSTFSRFSSAMLSWQNSRDFARLVTWTTSSSRTFSLSSLRMMKSSLAFVVSSGSAAGVDVGGRGVSLTLALTLALRVAGTFVLPLLRVGFNNGDVELEAILLYIRGSL